MNKAVHIEPHVTQPSALGDWLVVSAWGGSAEQRGDRRHQVAHKILLWAGVQKSAVLVSEQKKNGGIVTLQLF